MGKKQPSLGKRFLAEDDITVNPYRTLKDAPSMRLSMRITRWAALFSLVGCLIYGIFKGQADIRDHDLLLKSDKAVVEEGIITDVDHNHLSRGPSFPKVTVLTESGKQYTEKVGSGWRGTQGDTVVVTRHPDTQMWFMENVDKRLSTEEPARNGSTRVYVGIPSLLLFGVGAFFIFNKVMALKWDYSRRDTMQHSGVNPNV